MIKTKAFIPQKMLSYISHSSHRTQSHDRGTTPSVPVNREKYRKIMQ